MSGEARELVRAMLARNPKRRITPAQILEHPWVVAHAGVSGVGADGGAEVPEILQRMRAFAVMSDVKKAALMVGPPSQLLTVTARMPSQLSQPCRRHLDHLTAVPAYDPVARRNTAHGPAACHRSALPWRCRAGVCAAAAASGGGGHEAGV